MDEGRASRTAIATAYFRAHHYAHASPKIFEDSLAGALLSAREREAVEKFLLEGLAKYNPGMARSGADRTALVGYALRGLVVVLARARYTEDRLAEAMRDGVTQYVVIGAGLDTFALRRPDLQDRLRIIEIDHPATQASKQKRIREAGLTPPPHLHFAPADLEKESLAEVLSRTPYDPARPAFFSWLGVTMYLTGDAIRATLRSLRDSSAAGSQLVFDYIDRAAFAPGRQSPTFSRLIEIVRRVGEPMIFGFDPSALGAELASQGFRLLEDLGPEAQEALFFRNRTDGLRPTGSAHLARAAVVQGLLGEK
ncbi:MAG TPA: SAM-dependent methyltransferase [Syntrophales bacterium]|nr:SAM-dependent methyltransferase [Syntrophales bacterium]